MATTHYELAFSGELIDGANLAQARANLGQLFKANDAQLDRLFSGQRTVIKNNLELSAGRKYLQILKKSGVVGRLYDMTTRQEWIDHQQQEPATPATTEVSSVASTISATSETTPNNTLVKAAYKPSDNVAERPANAIIGTASAQVGVETPNWDIAPTGSDMQDEYQPHDTPAPDTSHLSLRPMQGNLVEPEQKEVPPPPDTSHLKLEE